MTTSITFSPVSEAEQIALTRKQMKTILKLTKDEAFEYELVGHNPSATVELYSTPIQGAGAAYRHHISDDGTYDSEQCEVPQDDGDWDWAPEGGWGEDIPVPPAPKMKKRIARDLSSKFTIRNNPDPVWDQQFQFAEVTKLPLHNVWTVVEGDNGMLYALTGYHVVNKLHYAVTEEPWTKEDEDIDYKWW